MAQIGFFDGTQKFKNNKPIRLIELFGGIKAQATALKELGVEFENYRYVDYDKYAVKSANAMYGTNFEPQDITKLTAKDLAINETDKYTYIMTYSFPCTDLSLAGKGLGMAKGSGTRSGLLWEVERLLLEMKDKPQVLLMENVPEVIGQKNMPHFAEWIKALEKMGYKNYWQNLKATDFGIPQSRNRTFMVSILGDYYYNFPSPIKLEYLLKDMLENNVDKKYYLSDKAINGVLNTNYETGKLENRIEKNGIMPTLCARDYKDPKLVQIAEQNLKTQLVNKLIDSNILKPYDIINHSFTNSNQKENSRLKAEYYIESNNGIMPTIFTRADTFGIVEPDKTYFWNYQESESFQKPPLENMARTLKANKNDAGIIQNLRIRKLTPKECWRLMGFRDELFDKAQSVNSNAQLYKQAGNSIVATVLMAIFGELLDIEWEEKVKNLIKDLTNG